MTGPLKSDRVQVYCSSTVCNKSVILDLYPIHEQLWAFGGYVVSPGIYFLYKPNECVGISDLGGKMGWNHRGSTNWKGGHRNAEIDYHTRKKQRDHSRRTIAIALYWNTPGRIGTHGSIGTWGWLLLCQFEQHFFIKTFNNDFHVSASLVASTTW